MHRRYKKLCALQATGQIEPKEKARLKRHLASCSRCRTFLDDIMRIGAQGMALPAANRAGHSLVEPPYGIRERFLQRAAAEGFRVNTAPVLAECIPVFEPASLEHSTVESSSRSRWLIVPSLAPFHAVMAVAACIVFGIFGYVIA